MSKPIVIPPGWRELPRGAVLKLGDAFHMTGEIWAPSNGCELGKRFGDEGYSSGPYIRRVECSGFWRSPRGENHRLNSRPGDVWVEPGDFTDSDRLLWLVQRAGQEHFLEMPEDLSQARAYIDEKLRNNL